MGRRGRHCPGKPILPGRPSADLVAHGGPDHAGKPADVLTVGERIEAANESDQTGGLGLPSHPGGRGERRRGDGPSYAIVAEKARLRALGLLATRSGHRRGMGTKQPGASGRD